MRLLRTQGSSEHAEFEEFFAPSIPPYAILSHTWGSDEVTYEDLRRRRNVGAKTGYQKIISCCQQAARQGLQYVWIDTCCIDKSNSAELSEAINSMYEWYANSQVCIVHLADVRSSGGNEIARSRWFTRGWTLQELIAPSDVCFYSQVWSFIGRKTTLSSTISKITSIDEDVLRGSRSLSTLGVARKMSWAASRTTTRREDAAYSLMGLFGVNMPILYGEGARAFTRLQEEIIKISDDHSIFAWNDCTGDPSDIVYKEHTPLGGLLASSPAQFTQSARMTPHRNWKSGTPFKMTNQGLKIELPILEVDSSGLCIGVLSCRFDENTSGRIGVHMMPVGPQRQQAHYARYRDKKGVVLVNWSDVNRATTRTIYVRNQIILPSVDEIQMLHAFFLRSQTELEGGYMLSRTWPQECWKPYQRYFAAPTRKIALFFSKGGGPNFVVLVRADTVRAEPNQDLQFRCYIQIRMLDQAPGPRNPRPEANINPLPWIEELSTKGSSKSYAETHDGFQIKASVNREMYLGEDAFPIDIDVRKMSEGPYELESVSGWSERSSNY